MANLELKAMAIDVPGRAQGDTLSFCMEAGQIWGVLGPNGAGKTTFLQTLAGLRAPRAGHIHLNQRPLHTYKRRAIAQQLGLVFQERHDDFPATVMETALMGRHPFLSPWQMESADDIELTLEALVALDIDHLADRLVSTLSGGERQRVSIATLMTQNPAIWLADEPTNHLDLHHQVATLELMAQQAAQGKTLVMCLHDLNLAARWCTHILLLYPNGQACWGDVASMLQPSALETLFNQRLQTAWIDGKPFFIPAR
ncbi:ABC transporter ATP-binding protein [Nitrincola tibetensis]|uniref:ABC transporter ATP-binding protein n=1 Tax=Nitrincola tibetensis TaxID=2219697 RepID=A0A364NSI3_9GAMM|nr:ABC transporter ATP-binding protein [Nitrincola tibetensis]RAU19855.1 ABC transporter ATP-binding protein [Nitrincola tibetensis]